MTRVVPKSALYSVCFLTVDDSYFLITCKFREKNMKNLGVVLYLIQLLTYDSVRFVHNVIIVDTTPIRVSPVSLSGETIGARRARHDVTSRCCHNACLCFVTPGRKLICD